MSTVGKSGVLLWALFADALGVVVEGRFGLLECDDGLCFSNRCAFSFPIVVALARMSRIRFFYWALLTVAVAVAFLSLIPLEEVSLGSAIAAEEYWDYLRRVHGGSRNLNHSETRRLYKKILAALQDEMSLDDGDERERALVCSTKRTVAKGYARSRDGSYALPLTDIVLQLRDSYVHGLRYLPVALRRDLTALLKTRNASFENVRMTVKQTRECLLPSRRGGGCPSYDFLTRVRGKTDEDILRSCTRSNVGYDKR